MDIETAPTLKRAGTEEKVKELCLAVPLFDVFKVEELDILAQYMNFMELKPGEHLFNEGEKGEYMCFVVYGRFDVFKKTTDGASSSIAQLGKGCTIGEMSLLDKSPRSTTVIARQAALVLFLSQKGFATVTDRHPALSVILLKKILRSLSLKMRLTTSKLADQLPPNG